jgi:hypothetical protein
MKKNKLTILALAAFVIGSTGCYTYQQQCAAYSYEENVENVEINEENS